MRRAAGLLLLSLAAYAAQPLFALGPACCCANGGDMSCCARATASAGEGCALRSCPGAPDSDLVGQPLVTLLTTSARTVLLTLAGPVPPMVAPRPSSLAVDPSVPPPRG